MNKRKILWTGLVIILITGLLAPMQRGVQAIEIPPSSNPVYVQTNGPTSDIANGDWYTSNNNGVAIGYHYFGLNIPPGWPSTTPIRIDLINQEINANNFGSNNIDEDAYVPTTFEVYDRTVTRGPGSPPNSPAPGAPGSLLSVTYSPVLTGGPLPVWTPFYTFANPISGTYILRTQTAANGQNGWRLRFGFDNDNNPNTPPIDDLDGIPGTNDELTVGQTQTAYQHDVGNACLTLYQFINFGQPSVTFNNFDMDGAARGTVTYTSPSNINFVGTASNDYSWNNGTQFARGGDTLANPEPGWWRIVTCIDNHNQFIQEGQTGIQAFYQQPPIPRMLVSKDDGQTLVSPGQIVTYTIRFTNTAALPLPTVLNPPGAANNVTLLDTLPAGMTYLGCGINPVFTGSCTPSGSNINFTINQAVPANPAPGPPPLPISGTVFVRAQVNTGPPIPLGPFTNTVTLTYTDQLGNVYPPVTARDIDTINPTAAQVGQTVAAPAPGGGITVGWIGTSEVNHLGYNVLRADSAKGIYSRVNAHLITSSSLGGGAYRFSDAQGTVKNWYRIEAVDQDNQTRQYPSFAVGNSLPAAPAAPDKAAQAAEGKAQDAANAQGLAALPHAPLLTSPYKLLVDKAGVVRVTYAQLQAAGVPLDVVNAAQLQLFTGPLGARSEVPLAMHAANAGVFAPGDWFDFINTSATTAYSDARAYYLQVASGPKLGLRMTQPASPRSGPAAPATFASTLHLEENAYYWQDVPTSVPAQAEGPWYWTYVIDDELNPVNFQAPDVAPGATTNMSVQVQGYTSDSSVPTDHHVAVYLNNTQVGERRWAGRTPQTIALTIPAGVLHSGANTLWLQTVADTGAAHDGVYLNSADLTYTRQVRASDNSLRLSSPGGSKLQIPGFTAGNGALYDVTNAAAPQQIAAQSDQGTLVTVLPGTGSRQLQAAARSGLLTPSQILPVTAGNLRSGGADYVVIAYDSLLPAAQDLAALHAGEGLSTVVVPVHAIYDQFGSGAPDANAISAFLTHIRQNWSPAPRYVALLGSASYDAHNYYGLGQHDLVPTGYVRTFFSGRTPSDTTLALAQGSGSKPGAPQAVPSLALGRLPARTPAEAQALVAKLRAYSAGGHQWTNDAGLVADAADAGSYNAASEALAGTLGTLRLDRIYESQYGGDTNARILAALNNGSALLNYYGHGSITQWSAGNIFNADMIGQVNNAGHETFVTSMTCYTGAYDWALGSGILNALVLKPTGGAIGGLGATAASIPTGQQRLNTAFYAQVQAHARLGDALLAGYTAAADRETVVQFHLIGDPALRLDLGR